PIAITVGAVFYRFFIQLSFLTPYLIFAMLFLTYCNLRLSQLRLSRLHIWLILIQLLGSLSVFFVLSPFNITLAQGAMICVLAPTGTAAPVITGMLKGNVGSLATYSLVSNMCVALAAPVIFSRIGHYQDLPFFESFLAIAQRVFVLLFIPFALAMALQKFTPGMNAKIASFSGLSFYLWSVALCIVTGRMVVFIIGQKESYLTEALIAAGALIVCAGQFAAGRVIGRRYDDTVAGGQGLGQKNTILAIWMAQLYLNPVASIGPGSYVLWQNIINSYQVWKNRKSL
ncbi:MAG: transporter, partial [Bacteroidota bacterium]|nr:transporter [Bacteroidota bacterium]